MGCKSSKDAVSRPQPVDTAPVRQEAWNIDSPSPAKKPISASSTKSRISNKSTKSNSTVSKIVCVLPKIGTEVQVLDGVPQINDDSIEVKRSLSNGSLDSACEGGSRGSSASSKASSKTVDSGLDFECPGMITEDSNPDEVLKVEQLGRPSTPDLSINGTKLESRKKSGGKKRQQTEEEVLFELRNQGILTTPSEQGQSGMAFDVMIAPQFEVLKRPPPRLASLKKRKSKKKNLTKEQVEEKLKAAEERKKRREQEMIEKLNTNTKEKQVHETLDVSVEQQRKQTEEKVSRDKSKAAANREAHFRALKEKLEEKKRHAARVRLLKLERLAEPQQEEGEEAKEIPPEVSSSIIP